MTEHHDSVYTERVERVSTIVLNRPTRLNALDDNAIWSLARAVEDVGASDTSVVVFTGAGRAFCAGGDRQTLASHGTVLQQVASLTQKGALISAIRDLPQVTVAAINGACAGLAVGIAGACQLRYAADTAVFNTAYLTLGLSGDFGVADTLVHTIGEAAARDWMLRPRKITAEQAMAQGFVQDVFSHRSFDTEIRRAAAAIAAAPAAARDGILDNIVDAGNAGMPFPDYLIAEARRHVHAKATTEALRITPPPPTCRDAKEHPHA